MDGVTYHPGLRANRCRSKAIALNCTLKPGRQKSSTYKLLGEVLDELEIRKITGDTIARPGCYFETARREASLQQPHHNGITP